MMPESQPTRLKTAEALGLLHRIGIETNGPLYTVSPRSLELAALHEATGANGRKTETPVGILADVASQVEATHFEAVSLADASLHEINREIASLKSSLNQAQQGQYDTRYSQLRQAAKRSRQGLIASLAGHGRLSPESVDSDGTIRLSVNDTEAIDKRYGAQAPIIKEIAENHTLSSGKLLSKTREEKTSLLAAYQSKGGEGVSEFLQGELKIDNFSVLIIGEVNGVRKYGSRIGFEDIVGVRSLLEDRFRLNSETADRIINDTFSFYQPADGRDTFFDRIKSRGQGIVELVGRVGKLVDYYRSGHRLIWGANGQWFFQDEENIWHPVDDPEISLGFDLQPLSLIERIRASMSNVFSHRSKDKRPRQFVQDVDGRWYLKDDPATILNFDPDTA